MSQTGSIHGTQAGCDSPAVDFHSVSFLAPSQSFSSRAGFGEGIYLLGSPRSIMDGGKRGSCEEGCSSEHHLLANKLLKRK